MASKKNFVLIGAAIAILGQFWGGPGNDQNLFLPLIGGALAGWAGLTSD